MIYEHEPACQDIANLVLHAASSNDPEYCTHASHAPGDWARYLHTVSWEALTALHRMDIHIHTFMLARQYFWVTVDFVTVLLHFPICLSLHMC